MNKLQPIQLEDGTVIYIEATEALEVPEAAAETEMETGEVRRGGQKGWGGGPSSQQIAQSFKAIEGTIKTYTQHTLNAFRDASMVDVKKVMLEFGVNVNGVAGVPYIASGTAGCNVKVTVECEFPDRRSQQ
jgi:hypothetical protein